jgi:hypothetical protein
MPIPKRRDAASFAFASQSITGGSHDFDRISTNKQVSTFCDGDRAFGILAQGEAGDAEGGGFFLDAAGVGQDEFGFAQEAKKIEIANGWNEPELGVVADAAFGHTVLSARMDRKNDRHFGRDGVDGTEKLAELFGGVNIGRAMESQDGEAVPARAILQSKFIADSGLLGDGQEVAQGIDHYVADHEDAASGPAFFQEVRDSVFFRNEEVVSESVGQDAVNFFGHGAVKAAEAGFDVGNADAKFRGGERNGDSGIDVADDQNQIRFALDKNRLDALQNFSGLRGVGAGADFQIHVRRRNTHLAKENVGQLFVVVLAGVDEDGLDLWMALHLVHERRNFREIGARADDIQDFQVLGHERSLSGFEGQYNIREIAVRRG